MLTALRWLAPLKVLRGTPFDPFGHTEERRMERALRDEFFEVLKEVASAVGSADAAELERILRAPQAVRGYGHIKSASVERYRAELAEARARLRKSRAAEPTAAQLEDVPA
jgi:indolepyruvate ferredoxin oxidoreductase